MLMLLMGIATFVPSLTFAVVDRRLPAPKRAGMIGTALIIVGAVGLVLGVVAKMA